MTPILPVDPPARLLMGPGPVNADPRVLRALATPLVGQYDPWMTDTMTETMGLYRDVFATDNEWTMLVDGTSRAGIEAALVSLIEPGDSVVVPVFGRFGHLLVEIAGRCGAEVHAVDAEWGTAVPASKIREVVETVKPKVLASVHGDTATTIAQPLAELGEIAAANGALFYVDATATLGGNPFDMDAWGIDVATAGLQKCLSGPPGSAPISLSDKAVDVINGRRSIEAGLRGDGDTESTRRIASNYFDLGMIMDYWGPKRLNHHTEATSMLYAARECARVILEEGRQNVIDRHKTAGDAMAAGLAAMGLPLYGDQEHKMANVVAVEIPEEVEGEAIRASMLADFGIEIGTSFGPLAGRVWRVGTMGVNARRDAVLQTLAALEQVLRIGGFRKLDPGAGVDAAFAIYQERA
ncbi:pyridoxal-phosphate-dependent aminotransferase family protein [Millisia brevis]|uniref:pyridoxal-phosphate-dependent aminotransferase family protein n=1 Tax=Millisia brevis TaxID=264148 RepID=UPI000830B451|nr:alanine--glyoxylate aminotransferase family protein [Millisia brevis]